MLLIQGELFTNTQCDRKATMISLTNMNDVQVAFFGDKRLLELQKYLLNAAEDKRNLQESLKK